MIAPTRRDALAGLLATTLAGRAGAATPPDALRGMLDRAAAMPAAAGLALLAGVDAAPLDEGPRLDLLTARAGLAADAAIARIGRPGRSPYRLGPRAGAWQRATDPAAIDAEREAVAADARDGIVLPRDPLERTVAAIRARRADPSVAAALARLADALASLKDRAPLPGMVHLPHGAAWYALLLQRHGVAGSPAEIDRRLAREQARLAARAAALFAAIGDRTGTLGDRYRRLWRDPRYLYPDDDAGRTSAVADMNATLATIRAALPAAIPGVPAWQLAVAARAMTPAEDAAGVQGFRELPTPGTPGAYVVDLRRIAARPSWTLPSVIAHELLPGHMVQLPLEAAARPHPLRLDYAVGFAEGWAIHAEEIAERQGWLGRDPRVRLGHLHWLLFRVSRARADLAIHSRGVALATERARIAALIGDPAYFIDIDADLARIVMEPGTRVAEASSWLAIRTALAGDPRRTYPLLEPGRRRDEHLLT